MSKKCELTGKSPLKGNSVSHANNKVKRKFYPNLKKASFMSKTLKRKITLNVSNNAIRTVDYKGGFDLFLQKAKIGNLSQRVKRLKKQLISKN